MSPAWPWRRAGRDDRGVEALAAEQAALGRELRELTAGIDRLARVADGVRLQTERLAAVQAEELSAAAALEPLAPLFALDRIAVHVREAVASSADHAGSLEVPALFPPETAIALAAAVPPALFFDEGPAGGRRIDLPLRLAPLASMVAWEFVLEQVVTPILVPVLLQRLAVPAEVDLMDAHLLLADPDTPTARADHDGAGWTVDIELVADGCRLTARQGGRAAAPVSGPVLTFRLAPR
ncbi:MAG: hypothetical protein AB7O67_04390 [Vicinamibacterales bacterium]